ncbi:hypothetical protein [Methylobacterium sp. ID0610]|uniref:hypothetical protein n=1 Tax=Methylobacterium carpenticola TaxID=3344827 RepID=UPI0036A8A5E3
MSTIITPKARVAAFACARGGYQVGLLNDCGTWSGSELTGRAASYGTKYRDSRNALLNRLGAEPSLSVTRATGERGRIIVVVMTKAERKRAGERPIIPFAEGIVERAAKARAVAERRAAREKARAERNLAADLPALEVIAFAR